ncbi:hypothetical protein B0H14DRAFT_3476792 [Mycena olivaceomarginata]|nr:hypothetical protein B0H14DRAFT_3476792 [Mycena olivaceomarginata]
MADRTSSPHAAFDFGVALEQRLLEQEATGLWDEDHTEHPVDPVDTPVDTPDSPPLPPSSSPSGLHPAPLSLASTSTLSAKDHNKQKSKARREKKRQQARLSAGTPLKAVHHKRIAQAKASALDIALDTTRTPTLEACLGGQPHGLRTNLSTLKMWSHPKLSGTQGFTYIGWLGEQHRVVITLGGMPRDRAGWKTVTEGAAALLRGTRLATPSQRRAATPIVAPLTRFLPWRAGWSHGGGQTELASCATMSPTLGSPTNSSPTHTSAASPSLPTLFAFYTIQMGLLAAWKPMRRNFAGSVFAACTFNFRAARHLCVAIWTTPTFRGAGVPSLALGDFDPDLGGHLILWDLRPCNLFSPGAPRFSSHPAVIRHSNVPASSSWVRNKFQTGRELGALGDEGGEETREEENKRPVGGGNENV